MSIDWTIILSIGGAFGAASTAQYLSHRLTINREDEKYKKEKYQNFYSPLVFKIIKYIESEGYSTRGINKNTNPNPDLIFNNILSTIENNIKYADSNFIKVYEKATSKMIDNQKHDEAMSRFLKEIDFDERINVFEQFLNDYLKISHDLKVLSKEVEKEVKEVIAIIKLYKLYDKYYLMDTAKILFSYGMSLIDRKNVKRFIKELEKIDVITNKNMKFHEKYSTKVPDKCYDDLFSLLHRLEPRLNSLFTSSSIKDALAEDIGIIGYKTNIRIDSSRLENINF